MTKLSKQAIEEIVSSLGKIKERRVSTVFDGTCEACGKTGLTTIFELRGENMTRLLGSECFQVIFQSMGSPLKTATIKRFLKTHPNFKSGSVESIKMQMEHERKDLRFLKEEMRQTDPTLIRLLKNFRSLTEWEQNFVLSVSQQFRRKGRLTDKQQRIVFETHQKTLKCCSKLGEKKLVL